MILRLVADHLDTLTDNIDTNSAIHEFASHLTAEDVVITFNWDIGFENAVDLVNPDLEWDYFWHPENKVKSLTILKAHGSIDWFRTEDIITLRNYQKELLDSNVGNISVIQWWSPLQLGIPKQCPPYIIPPTHFKSFREQEIRNIWRGISEVLRFADRVYIFGYSLPIPDLQARLILRTSIENNKALAGRRESILVANPDRRAKARFEDIGLNFEFKLSKFEALNFRQLLQ